MKLLTQVPESHMVATFLKGELTSTRFGDELRSIMNRLGIDKTILETPNLNDETENAKRTQLLGEYRGYGQNDKIFTNFPTKMTWYKAVLARDEIGELRYVDYSYWNELTDHTHLVKDAVNNIQNGKIVFDVPNDAFLELEEKIRKGKVKFEPIILWGKDESSPLTILEGHLRATALGLAAEKAPDTIDAIVGMYETHKSPNPLPAK